MKNKKFWITASILAVIIIVVVMVLRFGGKKVKVKKGYRWTFYIMDNGTENGEKEYDEDIDYVIVPYFHKDLVLYPGTDIELAMVPIKAVILTGSKKRIKVRDGIYIPKFELDIQ